MSIWEAMEKLSELVDDSDPDVGVLRFLHSVLPLCAWCAALTLARIASFFAEYLRRRISDI